jgi:hypothetical protein
MIDFYHPLWYLSETTGTGHFVIGSRVVQREVEEGPPHPEKHARSMLKICQWQARLATDFIGRELLALDAKSAKW